MNVHQRKTVACLEERGYRFAANRVPFGYGAILLTGRGHWIEHLRIVVNTDGSYQKVNSEEPA